MLSSSKIFFTCVFIFSGTPCFAQEFSDVHTQRRERGFICMGDHFHYGSSTDVSPKNRAVRAAIQSWADFVNFEYGTAWTIWARSGSKSVHCGNGGSGKWSCDVSARPCRR